MALPVVRQAAHHGQCTEPAETQFRLGPAATWVMLLVLALGAVTAGCASGGDDGGAAGRSPVPTSSSPSPEKTSSTADDGTRPTKVPEGVWAGEQLVLTVTAAGATAEFECAAGRVDESLSLDGRGRFDFPGLYANQPGGPAPSTDATPPALPARYRGRLKDATHLVLRVVLPRSGTTQGPFELELGGEDSLQRCA